MAEVKKQSAIFNFTVYGAGGGANVDLYSQRPKQLNQGKHYLYTLCHSQLKRIYSKLKFKIRERGKVKITIEIIERE